MYASDDEPTNAPLLEQQNEMLWQQNQVLHHELMLMKTLITALITTQDLVNNNVKDNIHGISADVKNLQESVTLAFGRALGEKTYPQESAWFDSSPRGFRPPHKTRKSPLPPLTPITGEAPRDDDESM